MERGGGRYRGHGHDRYHKRNTIPQPRKEFVGDPQVFLRELRHILGDEKLPMFSSKEKCLEWVQQHGKDRNGDERCVDLLVGWEQVKLVVLELRKTFRFITPDPIRKEDRLEYSSSSNQFLQALGDPNSPVYGIAKRVQDILELPFHAHMDDESVFNTLNYTFFHMKMGIYVKIKDNRLAIFAPFVNNNYSNNWSSYLNMSDEDIKNYYSEKRRLGTKEEIIPITKWWANGNMLCNVVSFKLWGDHLLAQQRNLLIECCESRAVPDVEFFLNKRDYPQLKANLTEPYDFLFDIADPPLSNQKYDSYAPIVSFFVSEEFADIPFPTSDDWEVATGLVFPSAGGENYSTERQKRYIIPWEKKRNTAFFRGSATGAGVTPETNQRLKLAQLSAHWKNDSKYNEKNPIDGVRFLDAGVVTWNFRDKKRFGEKMTFIKPDEFDFKKEDFVPMYEQLQFKYLVYVEGHCAAARYSFLMKIGAVILKVESTCKAKDLWSFPLLRPMEDHIPVKADLSDLAEKIQWCKTHDSECREIAARAQFLYECHLSRQGILDYVQFVLNEVHVRFSRKRPRSFEDDIQSKRNYKRALLTSHEIAQAKVILSEYDRYVSLQLLERETLQKLTLPDHWVCSLPAGRFMIMLVIGGFPILCDFLFKKFEKLESVRFFYRKDPKRPVSQALFIVFFLDNPAQIVVVDMIMFKQVKVEVGIHDRMLSASKELSVVKASDELTSLRLAFAKYQSLSEFARDETTKKVDYLSQGLLVTIWKEPPKNQTSLRSFVLWKGCIPRNISHLFDEQDPDFHMSLSKSPIAPPSQDHLLEWKSNSKSIPWLQDYQSCLVHYNEILNAAKALIEVD